MTIEQLKQKIDELDMLIAKKEDAFIASGKNDLYGFLNCAPKETKERDKLYRELRLIQNYELKPLIPCYIMTMQAFKKCCLDGGFIDYYDGFGMYCTETHESDICIYPSDVLAGKVRTDFTHVNWYNR